MHTGTDGSLIVGCISFEDGAWRIFECAESEVGSGGAEWKEDLAGDQDHG